MPSGNHFELSAWTAQDAQPRRENGLASEYQTELFRRVKDDGSPDPHEAEIERKLTGVDPQDPGYNQTPGQRASNAQDVFNELVENGTSKDKALARVQLAFEQAIKDADERVERVIPVVKAELDNSEPKLVEANLRRDKASEAYQLELGGTRERAPSVDDVLYRYNNATDSDARQAARNELDQRFPKLMEKLDTRDKTWQETTPIFTSRSHLDDLIAQIKVEHAITRETYAGVLRQAGQSEKADQLEAAALQVRIADGAVQVVGPPVDNENLTPPLRDVPGAENPLTPVPWGPHSSDDGPAHLPKFGPERGEREPVKTESPEDGYKRVQELAAQLQAEIKPGVDLSTLADKYKPLFEDTIKQIEFGNKPVIGSLLKQSLALSGELSQAMAARANFKNLPEQAIEQFVQPGDQEEATEYLNGYRHSSSDAARQRSLELLNRRYPDVGAAVVESDKVMTWADRTAARAGKLLDSYDTARDRCVNAREIYSQSLRKLGRNEEADKAHNDAQALFNAMIFAQPLTVPTEQ